MAHGVHEQIGEIIGRGAPFAGHAAHAHVHEGLVAGEELGFIGSVLIVLLLLFIGYQCIQTAKVAKDLSGKLICSGMAALVGFQSFVNICVVTGLFPNTGLPLPFVSYGLTSLVTMYFGMGFVLNVGLQAKKY